MYLPLNNLLEPGLLDKPATSLPMAEDEVIAQVPAASTQLLQVMGTCSKEISKILRVHDSKEDSQPNLDRETLPFASPTEYAQHLAQSAGSEFRRLANTDKYDVYFIQLGITKNGIQGGTEEETRTARQRCMHALVGQLWMEGRIKMGQCQPMWNANIEHGSRFV